MLRLDPDVAVGLQRAPIGVGASTDADEARDEDGGSGNECDQCEVHGGSPLASRPVSGIAALYYSVVKRDGSSVRAVVRS